MNVIQQTLFKMIYVLLTTILNLMIMFLKMTHTVIMTMINHIRLLLNDTKLQK